MSKSCNCGPGTGSLHEAIDRGYINKVRRLLAGAPRGACTQHDLDQGLMIACLNGNAAITALLLEAGADVRARNGEQWIPLMFAARSGDTATIQLLIERGSEINATNNYGRSALIEASWAGRTEAVKELIRAGSEIDLCPQKVGGPAIVEAAWNNHPETVMALIDAGANLQVRLSNQETLLGWAAGRGHTAIVRVLTDRGLNPNETAPSGFSPLMQAASRGSAPIVRILLDHGAFVNARDNEMKTALHWGALQSAEVVRVLIEGGADVNAEDVHHVTPVCIAAHSDKIEVVRCLLVHGAKAQPTAPLLVSPLHQAASRGAHGTVKLLLQKAGVDVNYRSLHGETALSAASKGGHMEIIRLLLQEGAEPSIADEGGTSPTLHAAGGGHLNALQQLVESGADPLGISQSGRTALGEALSSRSVTGKPEAERETVKWLIQRGADLDEPSQGRTPLMIAAVAGKVDQVRDLLDRGADPNVQTSEGESVLQLAAEVGAYNDRYVRPKNRKEDRMAPVIEVLLEAGADPAAEDSCAVLSAAAGYRCLDVVKALVAAGAPVDPPATGCEATPLMFATGSVRITRFLLKRGADPRARDPKGNTPLHWAAQQWRPRGKVLRALVRAGADIDSNGEYGDTPLIKASRTDVLENVETLLQLGADPSRVNHRGQTARDAAIERNYPSIVKAFEETALQG